MNTLKTVFGKLFKEETQLASHEVELALVDDIEKDVLANGKSADLARPLIRTAADELRKAYENFSNIKRRNESIIKNSNVFKARIKELGIEPTDQFQKNIIADLYVDKNIDAKLKAISTALSALNNTGEI
jgi:hypothetical protein